MFILILILYISTWLIATNFLVIWFRSSLPIYILKNFKFIPKDVYVNEKMMEYLVINKGKRGELLSCPICLAVWANAIVAATLTSMILIFLLPSVFFFIISLLFTIFCAFSLPFLSVLVLNKL